MSVFRVEKNKNYTVMSNVHLRDKTLSLKAKGLHAMILSLPDDWHYSVHGLVAICKESKASIISGLKELENAGIRASLLFLPSFYGAKAPERRNYNDDR